MTVQYEIAERFARLRLIRSMIIRCRQPVMHRLVALVYMTNEYSLQGTPNAPFISRRPEPEVVDDDVCS
jgi:hypothetical protein